MSEIIISDQVICSLIGAVGAIGAAWVTQGPKQRVETNIPDESISKNIRSFMKKNIFIFFLAPIIGLSIGWGVGNIMANPMAIRAPFEVSSYYYPSGWMGDGKKGMPILQLNDQYTGNSHTGPTCIKISYIPSSLKWAGIYWQSPADNWGDKEGRSIRGANKITFWARGENGGELVKFKAGGTKGKRYTDSFEKSNAAVELTKEWKEYEIDLSGENLNSVIGAFAWSASSDSDVNPNGLTFYLDDIRYE